MSDAARRRRGGPRWRAAGRLAVRQVLRDWRTSALVAALVALPLAGISALSVYIDSQSPTPDEERVATLGETAAWFRVAGGPDADRRQYLDDPLGSMYLTDEDGAPLYEEEGAPASPADAVPSGTELLSLSTATVEAETAGGLAHLEATVGDVGDPRLDGALRLVEGIRPLGPNEAAASPAALKRLGTHVGDTLTLTDPAATFTITGAMAPSTAADSDELLLLPGLSEPVSAAADPETTTWYSPDWAPSADELYALNAEGIVGWVPALAADPGDGAAPALEGQSLADLGVLGLSAAALAFCAYLVILLAGSAFAVSARRQQRQLAMAASVGADSRDVFRVVLLQGSVLGLLGGGVGIAAGIGIGAWVIRLDADGSASHPWGFHVPWLALAATLVFATAVGTASAVAPARTISRQHVIGALRGSRRPATPVASRPVWGSILLVAGIALTLAGGALVLFTAQRPWAGAATQVGTAAGMTGIIVGPILLQIGVIAAGHWLLALASRALSRVGLGARLASRDAAAAPSRVVPAFGAIAACVFLAAASIGAVGVITGQNTRTYYYDAPVGSVWLQVSAIDEDSGADLDPPEETVDAALSALRATRPTHVATFDTVVQPWPGDPEIARDARVIRPEVQRYAACTSDDDTDCTSARSALFGMPPGDGFPGRFDIVSADDLPTVLGGAVPDAALDAYRDGAAIVADDKWLSDEGELVLNAWEFWQLDGGEDETPQRTDRIPAVAVATGAMATGRELFVTPATADAIGLTDETASAGGAIFGGAVASYGAPPRVEIMDGLQQQLADLSAGASPEGESVDAYAGLEDGPTDGATWYALLVGGTAVLVIGASGIALGLSRAERRSDDATLAAVGGAPRLRRSVTFWQGLIISGFGCVTGVAAGVLPVFGAVLATPGDATSGMRASDIPWPVLAAIAFALPLAIAAASWLVPPRRPDLSRRTAIA